MARRSVSDYRPIPTVTSLPASPVDGMIVNYKFTQTVTPADPTVIYWQLIYDAGTSAWYPVGRQEPVYAFDAVNRSASLSVSAWASISTTFDPVATAPLSGDYIVEWGAGVSLAAGAGVNYVIGLNFSAGIPAMVNNVYPSNGVDPLWQIGAANTNATWMGSGIGRRKATMASGVFCVQIFMGTSAGTYYRGNTFIMLSPRKITGN